MSDTTRNRVHSKAVMDAVQLSGALTFGTRIFPYTGEELPPVRGTVAPPVKQWPITKDDLREQVLKLYDSMQPGEVRQLVAGTGVGKTTNIPYILATERNVHGVVALPDSELAKHVYDYVFGKFVELGGGVEPVILRTHHMQRAAKIKKKRIYMLSGSDVLARIYMYPGLFDSLGVTFLLLDESHMGTPDYMFARRLFAQPEMSFGTVRVIMASATVVSDLSFESSPLRTVSSQPATLMDTSNFAMLTARSALHYSNIVNRTAIFLATDDEVYRAFDYYNQHDIPAFTVPHGSSSETDSKLKLFLQKNQLCVVATIKYGTGYTHNFDTSICTGRVQELRTNFATTSVELVVRNVTASERTQRLGRVGRFKVGKAVYSDVPLSAGHGIQDDVDFYVYLWACLFNLELNEPSISRFKQLTGKLSQFMAAVLLHARVPPLLLLPYLAEKGFYKGWDDVLKNVTYSIRSMPTDDDNNDKAMAWPERNTGPVDYFKTPVKYKSLIAVPPELAVLPATAWLHYTKNLKMNDLALDTRSVISAVADSVYEPSLKSSLPSVFSTFTPKTSSARKPSVHFDSRQSFVRQRPSSGSTEEIYVQGDNVDHIRRALSTASVLPGFIEVPSPVETVVPSQIQKWSNSVVPATPTRLPPVLSESDGSDERDDVVLKQVDPTKYQFYKLYPMDPATYELYREQPCKTKSDNSRVRRLLTNKVNFAMRATTEYETGTTQTEYFLSILRVHNTALVGYAQTRVRKPAGMFARLLYSDVDDEKTTVVETSLLLRAAHIEGFYVGIDSRQLKSDYGYDLLMPSYDSFRDQAYVAMALGDAAVVAIIQNLITRYEPCIYGTTVVANAWWIGHRMVMTQHSCDQSYWQSTYQCNLKEVSDSDLTILCDVTADEQTDVLIRYPVDNELVYALAYSQLHRTVEVLGCFTVSVDEHVALIDVVFPHGYSGALMVALNDGAALALYVGSFDDNNGRIQLLFPHLN